MWGEGSADTLEGRAALRQAGGMSQYKTLQNLTGTNARFCPSEGRATTTQACEPHVLVLVGSKLNVNQQRALEAKKAKSIPGCVNGTASRLKEVITPLYVALIRQHPQHCIRLGSPSARKPLANRSSFSKR